MYFYESKGKQVLDMRGDSVLTHNSGLVKGRVKPAAPAGAHHATCAAGLTELGLRAKIKVTWMALRFIWARKSQELTSAPEGA